MRKSMLAALMAATVLVPAAATAQEDRPHRENRGGSPEQRGAQPQRERGGGGERQQQQQPAPAQAPVRPQVQLQAQVQATQQGDRGGRGSRLEFRDGRGNFGGYQQPQGQQQPQPRQQPQYQQQGRPQGQFQQPDRGGPDRGGPDRGGPDRGGEVRGGYRGNNVEAYRGNDRRDDGRGNVGRPNDGRGNGGRGGDGRGYDQRGYIGGRNNNQSWSRDWRRDNRYNYYAYRNQNRNAFHLPRYYAPYGWDYGYRRFSIGFSLSSILYDQDYWIDDADYYRLPPAYGPYRWVRYYNDALLVDLRTGYVVDTVYDIFW